MTINRLSVVIITKDNEGSIANAVQSGAFADEIIVLDSDSTDNTVQIAIDHGAKVHNQEWLGFGKQKNSAIKLAKNNWVFVLDSDETITQHLANEIESTLKHPKHMGYFIARLNTFFGKQIKTCGLYPDYSVRLFDKSKAQFSNVSVHESVQMDSPAGYLKAHMTHNAYETIDEFITKQNRYSSLHSSKRNLLKAITNPYWTFIKMYFLQRGFLDGWHGYVISKLYAQYTFWKYIK